jgi:hypothetical protein
LRSQISTTKLASIQGWGEANFPKCHQRKGLDSQADMNKIPPTLATVSHAQFNIGTELKPTTNSNSYSNQTRHSIHPTTPDSNSHSNQPRHSIHPTTPDSNSTQIQTPLSIEFHFTLGQYKDDSIPPTLPRRKLDTINFLLSVEVEGKSQVDEKWAAK